MQQERFKEVWRDEKTRQQEEYSEHWTHITESQVMSQQGVQDIQRNIEIEYAYELELNCIPELTNMNELKERQSPLDAIVWRRDSEKYKKEFEDKKIKYLKVLEQDKKDSNPEPARKKFKCNNEPEMEIKHVLTFQSEMTEKNFGMDKCFDTILFPDSPMYDAIEQGLELVGAGRNPKLFKMGTYKTNEQVSEEKALGELEGGAKLRPGYAEWRAKHILEIKAKEKRQRKKIRESQRASQFGPIEHASVKENKAAQIKMFNNRMNPNLLNRELAIENRRGVPQPEGEDLTTSHIIPAPRTFVKTTVAPIQIPRMGTPAQVYQEQIHPEYKPKFYAPPEELLSEPEDVPPPASIAIQMPQLPPPLIPLTFKKPSEIIPRFAPPPAPKLKPLALLEEEIEERPQRLRIPTPEPEAEVDQMVALEDLEEDIKDQFDSEEEDFKTPAVDVEKAIERYKQRDKVPTPYIPPVEEPLEAIEPLEEETIIEFNRPFMTHHERPELDLADRLDSNESNKELKELDAAFENRVMGTFETIENFDPNPNLFISALNTYGDWLDTYLMPYLERRKKSYLQLQSRMKAIKQEEGNRNIWVHWILIATQWIDKLNNRLRGHLNEDDFDRVKYAIDSLFQWDKKIITKNKEIKAKKISSKDIADRLNQHQVEKIRRHEIGHRNQLTEREQKQQDSAYFSGLLTVKTGVLQAMRRKHEQDDLNDIAQSCYRIREKQTRPGKRKIVQCEVLFSFSGFRIDPGEDAAQSIAATLGVTHIIQGNIKYKYQTLINQEIKHWSHKKWQISFLMYIKHHEDKDRVHMIQKKTSQVESYEDALQEAIEIIEQLSNNYESDVIMIKDFYIGVITQREITADEIEHGLKELPANQIESSLIGGAYHKIEKKLSHFKDKYFIVNPTGRINCLWTAYITGKRWNKLHFEYELNSSSSKFPSMIKTLIDSKFQNQGGERIKRKIEAQFKNFGTELDLENICEKEKQWIKIKDSTGYILREFNAPELSAEEKKKIKSKSKHKHKILKQKQIPIQLLLDNNHYYTLIPYDQIPYTIQCKIKEKDEIKNVDSGKHNIIRAEHYQQKDLSKIICYDLESYQEMGDTEDEINQIAYAVGWSFIIETEAEENYILEKEDDFDIEEFEIHEVPVRVAFRRILGEHCLEVALQEWMHESIYNHGCFYAHNGGKFDLRLILGQSDLCYNENYMISHENLIELNGRFLNMTVYNVEEKDPLESNLSEELDLSNHHTIHFKDSLPLFGVGNSLANLCKEFDVVHKKLEEKLGVHERMFKHTWRNIWQEEDLDKYLRNDCIGLLEVLYKFEKECFQATDIHITEVHTGASLARKYYLKKMYQDSEFNECIFTLKKNEDEFVRKSFAGGRVENFVSRKVDEKLYYYDFTSLYPDVACLDLPCGKPLYVIEPSKLNNPDLKAENQQRLDHVFNTRVYQNNKGFLKKCFWKVRVCCYFKDPSHPDRLAEIQDILKNRKPIFGVKNDITKNMLLFPWLETIHETDWQEHGPELTLYEEEIQEAIKLRLPYHFYPIQGLMFRSKPLLKDAMENLFKMKADAKRDHKPALSKLWKIVINSLYGVWGIRKFDREGLEIATSYNSNWCMNFMKNKLIDMNNIGNYIVTRILKDLPTNKCNVAIASAITSEARLKLYRLMWDIQSQGGQVYYCDTDSIITNYCIEDDIMLKDKWIGDSNGEALGSLKNEIDECYDKYLKSYPEEKEHIMEIDSQGNPRRKRYFDQSIIVAPKMYIVTAEDGKIIKKAHKGFKENKEKDDIVTFDRMNVMVEQGTHKEQRIMEQDMIQWRGANGEFMTDKPIGVTLVKIHKQIRATINKGTLDPQRNVIAFRSLEEVTENIYAKQREISKKTKQKRIDQELHELIGLLSPPQSD